MAQITIPIQIVFDDLFIDELKKLQPKRGGIYKKAYKDIVNELCRNYYATKKELKKHSGEVIDTKE